MQNQIICPECKRTITNNAILDAAAKGEAHGTEVIICECGERIKFWALMAQLREQRTFGKKIQNWFHAISGG